MGNGSLVACLGDSGAGGDNGVSVHTDDRLIIWVLADADFRERQQRCQQVRRGGDKAGVGEQIRRPNPRRIVIIDTSPSLRL